MYKSSPSRSVGSDVAARRMVPGMLPYDVGVRNTCFLGGKEYGCESGYDLTVVNLSRNG